MKIHELLNEAISLTQFKTPLHNAIVDTLLNTTKKLYYTKQLIAPEVEADIAKHGNLHAHLYPYMTRRLIFLSVQSLSDTIKKEIHTYTKISSHITFKELNDEGYGGYASGLDITLNSTIISKLAKEILDYCFEHALNSLEGGEADLVPSLLRVFKNIEARDIIEHSDYLIRKLVSTVIHELVHVIQHSKQQHRPQTAYRSYLTRDKSKFYAAMNRMHQGTHDTADYRLYRGSPQEIAAFAHEEALKIINDTNMGDADENELAYIKKHLPSYMQGYTGNMFSDPTNEHEYKIFKRFNKIVYQEVSSYLDKLIATAAEQKKQQPAEY